MSTVMLRRVEGGQPWARDVNQLIDVALGNLGSRLNLVGYDGDEKNPIGGSTTSSGNPTLLVRNTGGYHVQVQNAAGSANIVEIRDTGLRAVAPFNVGNAVNAADAGDAWIQNGLSVGTYTNPTTGQVLASALVKAPQLETTVTAPTAPIVIGNANTTLVTNLNADLLDGKNTSVTGAANSIPRTDGATTLDASWIPSGVGSGVFLPLAGGTMTGQLVAAVGSVTAPGIAFSGDTNTGIYWQSADYAKLAAGGNDVLRWKFEAGLPKVGIGVDPSYALHVSAGFAGDYVSAITNTAATGHALRLETTEAAGTYSILNMFAGGAFRMNVYSDGGVRVGAATGGGKGLGTINLSGGLYLNNTAYTNPDYALEHWATGRIVRHKDKPGAADYPGRMSLDAVEAYAREHFQLPRVSERRELFSRADILLEKIEEIMTYLFDLNRRLTSLERTYALARAA